MASITATGFTLMLLDEAEIQAIYLNITLEYTSAREFYGENYGDFQVTRKKYDPTIYGAGGRLYNLT